MFEGGRKKGTPGINTTIKKKKKSFVRGRGKK